MAHGVAAGSLLAVFRSWPGALGRIAAVRCDLPERGHEGATAEIGFVFVRATGGERPTSIGQTCSGFGASAFHLFTSQSRRERMGFEPERAGGGGRINARPLPQTASSPQRCTSR